ncbi:MAG: CidA/LrgA family protein [Betaproteobacteria bacterium]|nr:CidA/LrgA family protein [Betaproteobacteria bacterium]
MPLIPGLTQILLFQGLGEVISRFAVPALPGPVIGLIALLLFLVMKGGVNPAMESVANGLIRHLGLLFVPAAVGVILFLPQLRVHWLAISLALVASVVATIAVTALVLRGLARGKTNARHNQGPQK